VLGHLAKCDPSACTRIRADEFLSCGDLKDTTIVMDNAQSPPSEGRKPINRQLDHVVEVGSVRSVLTVVGGTVRPNAKRKIDCDRSKDRMAPMPLSAKGKTHCAQPFIFDGAVSIASGCSGNPGTQQ
jgi:hypothetical protein